MKSIAVIQYCINWLALNCKDESKLKRYSTLFLLALIFMLLFILFIKIANANSGFISAVALFFVIPFTIASTNMIEKRRIAKNTNSTLQILAYEFWQNLNHVSAIEHSHNNNIKRIAENETSDHPEIGYPHYAPRLAVIDKLITSDHILSLDAPYPMMVAETYGQLCELREEFFYWKKMITEIDLSNLELYEAISSSTMSYIDTVMRNMLTLWIDLIRKVGHLSPIPQINHTASIINITLDKKIVYRIAYKASWIQRNTRRDKIGVQR
ncbi:hypothetical protein [Desulfocurvus sp. DL9XJH121]